VLIDLEGIGSGPAKHLFEEADVVFELRRTGSLFQVASFVP
jgi:hypothetical protein